MQYLIRLGCVLALLSPVSIHAAATTDPEPASSAAAIAELRTMLEQVKADYDARINELEARLAVAERSSVKTHRIAVEAIDVAEETAITASAGQSGPNAFNPAISAVLMGTYAVVDDSWEVIPGFATDGELGPGGSGFALGESEINFKAAIDDLFFGNLTLALEDEDGDTQVSTEEAWVQTLALPYGLSTLAGRYFSNIGYLNKFHRHADDFSDRPLPYQAFFGGQYVEDGARINWIAPTRLLFELGAETNWSNRYPNTGGGMSPGAWDVYANLGGDIGYSNSWQFGLSYIDMNVKERAGAVDVADTFTGSSKLTGLDFVWKWAPEGNPTQQNFKLQAEYFYREEDGLYANQNYNGNQDGWYVQGVWQFRPQWRVGYRYDTLSSDNGNAFVGTALEDPDNNPKRNTVMVDWSHSEFSRLRLQYTYDQVYDNANNQLVLQYIMSMGAHGAHEF
jgi:hypothetical protein